MRTIRARSNSKRPQISPAMFCPASSWIIKTRVSATRSTVSHPLVLHSFLLSLPKSHLNFIFYRSFAAVWRQTDRVREAGDQRVCRDLVPGLGGGEAARMRRQGLRRRERHLHQGEQGPHRVPLRDHRDAWQGQFRPGAQMLWPQEEGTCGRQNNPQQKAVNANGHTLKLVSWIQLLLFLLLCFETDFSSKAWWRWTYCSIWKT